MNNSIKIILFIILGIVVVNFATTLFSNSNVRDIRKDLQDAKRSADSALAELKNSKDKIDSIKADVIIFRAYINRIQKTVELNDAEKRVKDERDMEKVKVLKENIKAIRADIANDSLPPIDVLPTK